MIETPELHTLLEKIARLALVNGAALIKEIVGRSLGEWIERDRHGACVRAGRDADENQRS